jgi:hypothetical protein
MESVESPYPTAVFQLPFRSTHTVCKANYYRRRHVGHIFASDEHRSKIAVDLYHR